MPGEITLNQLLQPPVVAKVVSQLKNPISAFQQFFQMTPGSSSATERVQGDAVSWDIFNATRTLAKIKARGVGPGRSTEKPIGANSATVVRMHDSVHLEQEKIFRTRDLGMGWNSPVDIMGQKYVERQFSRLSQKFSNGREFMLSRLFRNGFGIKSDGDSYQFAESGDALALYTVNYQIPNTNLNGGALGGGANIITKSFDDPSAPVMDMFYALRAGMIRQNGYNLKHFWMNSVTFTALQNNIQLAVIAGSANTVFTSITGDNITKDDADSASGYTVMFRGLPLFVFHVYDGVLNPGGVDDIPSTSTYTSTKMIPDGYMIGHPDQDSSWIGCVEGSEVVAESYMDPGKHVSGFHTWKNRTILPPGWDLIGVDNWLPILYIPTAVVYLKVIF